MKIQSSFSTKFSASQYLKDRGWVKINSTVHFEPVFAHPRFVTKRLVQRVNDKWYISVFSL